MADSFIQQPAFAELLKQVGKGFRPPIENWHPTTVGEMEFLIRRDGVWEHENREIHRTSIAKVFSTILRKESSDYYLVTPVQKFRVQVEATPFVIKDMEFSGSGKDQQVLLKTNFDEVVPLDEEHPLSVTPDSQGDPLPLVRVRDELDARILSTVYARFVDLVEDPSADQLKLWSFGQLFEVF